jgi:hypothetical protein
MARLTPAWRLAVAAAGWLAFVCATERWMRWGEPIRRLYATDELQYQSIARAAPGLPDTPVSAAAAQRVATHWLVGSLADLTGVGVHTAYRVAAVLCVLALTYVLVRLCLAFALPEWAAVAALGLVLTNPYTLRLLLIAPAMLSDAVLVLGTAIALLGLVEERWPLAVAGCVVAALGREMGLAVAVGVCVWLLLRRRFAAALLALVVPAGAFALAKAIGESFSLPNPSATGFTIISPLAHLPNTAGLLADHFGRVAIAAPVALAVLLASLVALAIRHELHVEASPLWAAVLLAGLMLVQPVVFNPEWVQHNESRLAALGIVPLAFAAAAALARTGLRPPPAATALMTIGIALASLHHRYSWSGLVIPGSVFVAVEALVSGGFALLVLWTSRVEPAPAPGGVSTPSES